MKITKYRSILILIAFAAISYIQHFQYLNLDIQGIHCWRQTQTMWNIRNFVRHDNNILNPRINKFNGGKENILRYEFPLMQWTIAQFQRYFGENIAVVRNLLFFIGFFSVLCMFFIIQFIFKDWTTSLVTAILFQYTPVFYYYTINPIPDNLALCCSLFYIYFILRHKHSDKYIHLIAASVFLLIATWSKLPYIMFAIMSILFFINDIITNNKITTSNFKYAIIQLSIISPAIAWYIWVIPTWSGNPVLTGGLDNSFIFSEYLNIAKYHLTVMFPEILLSKPSWVLIGIGLLQLFYHKKKYSWIFSLIIITFCYLLFEFKPIGTVHDYYMLPFLSWLFFVIGLGVYSINRFSYGKYILALLCIWSVIYTPKHTHKNWSIESSYFNPDVFMYSEELKNAVPDNEPCIILNDISGYIFSYRVDKMGYVFSNDHLPIPWIKDIIQRHHVKYMYSDSEKLNNSEAFQKFLEATIMTKGSVKVFQLKNPDG